MLRPLARLTLAFGVVIGVVATQAGAATLHVANHGADGPGCGSKQTPCRTISRAVANAGEGDKIVVRPGRYGDVDGNGVATGPGEEDGVLVDKRVTIVSRDGAAATVIDGGGAVSNCVSIIAGGAVLGAPTRGFTVSRCGNDGVYISSGADGVRVAGIRASRCGTGFSFGGNGHVLTRNLATRSTESGFSFAGDDHVLDDNVARQSGVSGFSSGGSRLTLTGNSAVANGDAGFSLGGSGHALVSNRASGNGSSGFSLGLDDSRLEENVALENDDAGFSLSVDGVVLRANVARLNGDVGFSIGGDDLALAGNLASANGGSGFVFGAAASTLTGNVAVGNGDDGFSVSGAGNELAGNVAAGNALAGVRVLAPAPVTGGSLYGNGPSENCGLRNQSGAAIDASGNFWGAPGGPGPDPADLACDVGAGSASAVDPVAKKERRVRVDRTP